VFIHALVAPVWARPKPSILRVLNCLDEVLAHLVRRRSLVSLLTQNNLVQLLFVPISHIILLLSFLFRLLINISAIRIQTPLLRLPLHRKVVRELTLASLFAVALLEELAEHRLGVDTEWHLLHLYGLEEVGDFAFGVLGGLLFPFSLQFLGFFALLVRVLGARGCLLGLLNLFPGGTTFFLSAWVSK